MSVASKAQAAWQGDLASGSGTTTLVSSGLGTFNVNWKARSEGSEGATTPEELLGAAHAACYSMAMAHALAGRGLKADSIAVASEVTFVPGEGITRIGLRVSAVVAGLDDAAFASLADDVKAECPVSKALTGTTIDLDEVTLA